MRVRSRFGLSRQRKQGRTGLLCPSFRRRACVRYVRATASPTTCLCLRTCSLSARTRTPHRMTFPSLCIAQCPSRRSSTDESGETLLIFSLFLFPFSAEFTGPDNKDVKLDRRGAPLRKLRDCTFLHSDRVGTFLDHFEFRCLEAILRVEPSSVLEGYFADSSTSADSSFCRPLAFIGTVVFSPRCSMDLQISTGMPMPQ